MPEDELRVYQVDDYDFVAARSQQEAVSWYLKEEEITEEDIYEQPIQLPLDTKLHYMTDENSIIRNVTYRELIQEAISEHEQFPCIIATLDW